MHIVSLHHLVWDDSKVSGTKKRNKTAGAYSGIPGDDMRRRRLKGELKVHGWAAGERLLAQRRRAPLDGGYARRGARGLSIRCGRAYV
ncbi:hypothetical protein LJ656_16010 [Paraburkholderia sp. MMS20-SJTR3]|uniref:Uncharacterized protein n=1 Tax=Paraburkholderia sejongensis TaxID=2886946 RepID=A0ABS8JW30_9BURK|nr:hypothetical protein [Paraburkholderia sp. MMS20-SJTR3]MCC8394102.1 hypothetical protein [Paraburkholderia sp. MMS20-SJTR3]